MVFISKLAFDQRFFNKKTGHLDRYVIILFLLIVKKLSLLSNPQQIFSVATFTQIFCKHLQLIL